jgi:hypothetical protein
MQVEALSLAIIWVWFGPYHNARLNALRGRRTVSALQLSSHQELYGWTDQDSGADTGIVTLGGHAWEQASKSALGLAVWRALT